MSVVSCRVMCFRFSLAFFDVAEMAQTVVRVLFLSLEFADPIFSGNGYAPLHAAAPAAFQ